MSDRARWIIQVVIFALIYFGLLVWSYKDGFTAGVFRAVQDYEDEKARRRWWQFWKK
jgi:hypothetical protein